MLALWGLLSLFWFLGNVVARGTATNNNVAFFWDSTHQDFENFSSFTNTISNQFNLKTFDIANDEPESLFDEFGAVKFSTMFISPCKTKRTSSLFTSEDLIKYTNNGGNILIFNDDSGLHTDLAYYLAELGIHIAPKDYQYLDYQNYNPLKFLNNVIIPSTSHSAELKNNTVAILTNNEHIIPLLQAAESSKSFEISKPDSIWHLGSEGYLAAAFQGLNNARTAWFGANTLFLDESYQIEVVKDLVNWVSQRSGIIKASDFKHLKVNKDADVIPGYKVGDIMHFDVSLKKLDGEKWVPYVSDTPVQLEFVMLDPYYRLNLIQNNGNYSTEFKLPDQHGLFTIKLDYKRPGWSYITQTEVVPVRHLANDEYPRSWEIHNAWVYLNSYAVVVIAWFLFIIGFLLSGKPSPAVESKKDI